MVKLGEQDTPITLLGWIRLYDTNERHNYSLEFLAAATDGSVDIPDAHRYQVPRDVPRRSLDETLTRLVGKKRLKKSRHGITRNWTLGKKPWAITTLDQLREVDNPFLELDLLNARLYNGKTVRRNAAPYAIDSLPGIIYLSASVLFSGNSRAGTFAKNRKNERSDVLICPSKRLPRHRVEEKLKGAYTGCDRHVRLKAPYANLVTLLGKRAGALAEKRFNELGLSVIEKLVYWTEEGMLGRRDLQHAQDTLTRFAEALMDHRYGRYEKNEWRNEGAYVTLPVFNYKRTSERLAALVMRVFAIVAPDVEFTVQSQPREGKYFHRVNVRTHSIEALERRFAA